MTEQLAATIDAAWEQRATVSTTTTGDVRDAVEAALALLDSGHARVAGKIDGAWTVNQWL
jgi:2,3,4,5-tetrahydropyridine-2-carboxylate N-succinyltransferase